MPRKLSPSESHADSDVEAVGVLVAFMAVRCGDVDGGGQENGNVHCDDRPRPKTKRHSRTLGVTRCLEGQLEGGVVELCGHSPQQHHTVCHKSTYGDICNEKTSLTGSALTSRVTLIFDTCCWLHLNNSCGMLSTKCLSHELQKGSNRKESNRANNKRRRKNIKYLKGFALLWP